MFKSLKSFWLLWIFATTISSGISCAVIRIFARFFDDYHLTLFEILAIAFYGFMIGFSQWIILRRSSLTTWAWIPATTLGVMFGLFFGTWVAYGLLGASGFSFTYKIHWIG